MTIKAIHLVDDKDLIFVDTTDRDIAGILTDNAFQCLTKEEILILWSNRVQSFPMTVVGVIEVSTFVPND